MNEIEALSILAIAFIAVIAVVEYIKRRFHISGEVSRKVVHMAIGLLCIFAPFEFRNHWLILGISSIFIAILLFSRKTNWLSSIHEIERKSLGAYLLPICIYFTFMVYRYYDYDKIFYLPLIVVTISDPLASVAGMTWKRWLKQNGIERKRKYSKTVIGTITFFITALVSSILFLSAQPSFATKSHVFYLSIVVSILSTVVEAISYGGWDNITVPVTAAAILAIYTELLV